MPKVITYDGRYRLGCEGILYILIEPFSLEIKALTAFDATIQARTPIEINSYYSKAEGQNSGFGSELLLQNQKFPVNSHGQLDTTLKKFQQVLAPCFKLVIVGAEHDAVQLSSFAANMGWEVSIIAHPT